MENITQRARQWIRENVVTHHQPPATHHDPQAWKEDLQRWMLSTCRFRDRAFGGVSCLHRHFCDWQLSRNDVPPSRAVFDALLRDVGFLATKELVYGLVLKEREDIEHSLIP